MLLTASHVLQLSGHTTPPPTPQHTHTTWTTELLNYYPDDPHWHLCQLFFQPSQHNFPPPWVHTASPLADPYLLDQGNKYCVLLSRGVLTSIHPLTPVQRWARCCCRNSTDLSKWRKLAWLRNKTTHLPLFFPRPFFGKDPKASLWAMTCFSRPITLRLSQVGLGELGAFPKCLWQRSIIFSWWYYSRGFKILATAKWWMITVSNFKVSAGKKS